MVIAEQAPNKLALRYRGESSNPLFDFCRLLIEECVDVSASVLIRSSEDKIPPSHFGPYAHDHLGPPFFSRNQLPTHHVVKGCSAVARAFEPHRDRDGN